MRSDRRVISLLALILVAACEGSYKPAPHKRPDAGVPSWPYPPTPPPSLPDTDGGIWETDRDAPENIPQVGCTAAESPCGSGKPACCTGAICASYPNFGMRCGQVCKASGDCPSGCCVATSTTISVCAPKSFCPGSSPSVPPPDSPSSDDSCAGLCGKQAPGGCWCDATCSANGDCCKDVVAACNTSAPTPPPPSNSDAGPPTTPPPTSASCAGHCGDSSPSGCWCDVMCAKNNDCCADAKSVCGL